MTLYLLPYSIHNFNNVLNWNFKSFSWTNEQIGIKWHRFHLLKTILVTKHFTKRRREEKTLMEMVVWWNRRTRGTSLLHTQNHHSTACNNWCHMGVIAWMWPKLYKCWLVCVHLNLSLMKLHSMGFQIFRNISLWDSFQLWTRHFIVIYTNGWLFAVN